MWDERGWKRALTHEAIKVVFLRLNQTILFPLNSMLCFPTFLPSQTLHLLPDVPFPELSNRQLLSVQTHFYTEAQGVAKSNSIWNKIILNFWIMQSYFSRLRLNVSSLKHVHKQKSPHESNLSKWWLLDQLQGQKGLCKNSKKKKLPVVLLAEAELIVVPERKSTETKVK